MKALVQALPATIEDCADLRTKTRMAEDKLASPRPASTSATKVASDTPRSIATDFSPSQNARSNETLVRCPAIVSECLTMTLETSRLASFCMIIGCLFRPLSLVSVETGRI